MPIHFGVVVEPAEPPNAGCANLSEFDEIVWNKRLADVLSLGAAGTREIDYARFHDVEDL